MAVTISSADQHNKSDNVKMRQRCLYVSLVPGLQVGSRFRSDERSARCWRGLRTMLAFLLFYTHIEALARI
jgi:hypothetical protein